MKGSACWSSVTRLPPPPPPPVAGAAASGVCSPNSSSSSCCCLASIHVASIGGHSPSGRVLRDPVLPEGLVEDEEEADEMVLLRLHAGRDRRVCHGQPRRERREDGAVRGREGEEALVDEGFPVEALPAGELTWAQAGACPRAR